MESSSSEKVETASTTQSTESKKDPISLRPGGGISLRPGSKLGSGLSFRPGGGLGSFSSAKKAETPKSTTSQPQSVPVSNLPKKEKEISASAKQNVSEISSDPKHRRYERNYLKGLHGVSEVPPELNAILEKFPELVPKQTLFHLANRPRQTQEGRKSKTGKKNEKDRKPKEPVEFPRKAETPWTPSLPMSEKDQHVRTLQGILNKITPQTFDKLTEKICSLFKEIADCPTYENSVGLVFDKAVSEPNFSKLYTKLCGKLVESSPSLEVEKPTKEGEVTKKKVNFRTFLLNKCQQEFENQSNDFKILREDNKDEEAYMLAKEKAKRRKLGNIKFIGELFKANLISDKIIHECIKSLFEEIYGLKNDSSMKKEDKEDGLENVSERLCKLMSTIGAMVDIPKAKKHMDYYFTHIKSLQQDNVFSPRIRFMYRDLLELRENKWVPRREENIPKTLAEIHQEAKQKAFEEEFLSNYALASSPSFESANGKKKKQTASKAKAPAKAPMKTKAPAKPKKEINFEDELDMILKEYFSSNDVKEASSCIKSLVKQFGRAPQIVETALLMSSEEKNRERELTSTLFIELVNDNVLSKQDFEQGLKNVVSLVPDLIIDIPLIKKYLQEFISKALSSDLISVTVGNEMMDSTKQ